MNAENGSAAIVRALLGLGHGLGVVVTAEGIESATQRDALIDQGFNQGQGYLFSKAVPAAELAGLFEADGTFQASPEAEGLRRDLVPSSNGSRITAKSSSLRRHQQLSCTKAIRVDCRRAQARAFYR
jgi:hypothetical protein